MKPGHLAGLLRVGFSVSFVALIAMTSALPAAACSCGQLPPIEEALEQADVVFAGRVVGLQLQSQLSPDPTVSFAVEDLVARFAASSWWKGDPDVFATVYTTFTCCVCGFPFEIGASYLVYAELIDGVLRTSICSRTKLLEAASEDLIVLGGLEPASAGTTDVEEEVDPCL